MKGNLIQTGCIREIFSSEMTFKGKIGGKQQATLNGETLKAF